MNWLAHLYLSEPNAEYRIGNLLPDMLPIGALSDFPPEVQRGIAQHRKIDTFTDAHPIVRARIKQMPPEFRRFGGVLVDIFFDHFLARDWHLYSDQTLADFSHELYTSFDALAVTLPTKVVRTLGYMRRDDRLCSYATISGIAITLKHVDARLLRSVQLSRAIVVLEHEYEGLERDFRAFFPELQRYVGREGKL